jgi:hypothetical protein
MVMKEVQDEKVKDKGETKDRGHPTKNIPGLSKARMTTKC